LEFDNAPDWLIAYMQYQRTVMNSSPTSIMTYFMSLREFCQWIYYLRMHDRAPRNQVILRSVSILDMPLFTAAAVSRSDIEAYLYYLSDTLSNAPATRNKKLVAVRTFYDYVLEYQDTLGVVLAANPADRIRRPKLPKKQPVFLPGDAQQALLDSIDGTENAVRDYAIFLLMLTTGMRVSEAVGINMKDLNLDAMTCKIRGKGNKERIAHLTIPCRDAISDYLDGYRILLPELETDALFVSKRNKDRLTTRSVEKALQKYILKAKLGGNDYTPHKLRHTAATTLAKSGADLLVIQQVLGHESPGTTEIYTHLGNEDIANAINSSALAKLGNS
jgi:site-specific recombinase XerD